MIKNVIIIVVLSVAFTQGAPPLFQRRPNTGIDSSQYIHKSLLWFKIDRCYIFSPSRHMPIGKQAVQSYSMSLSIEKLTAVLSPDDKFSIPSKSGG
jgi:hypothetical protein